MNVLVVEDDAVLGKAIERGLLEKGYQCQWCRNGRRGQEQALAQKFDAIVLDLMIPDLNGLEVLKSIRHAGIQTPVIILTALGSVEDRVNGLNAGADDYLVKPFEFAELLARLHAISRRSIHLQSSVLEVGNLMLEKPMSGGRDAVDLISTVGAGRRFGPAVTMSVEAVGQDLEGFWDPTEKDGGARLMVGPSLSIAPPTARWQLTVGGGPIVRASQSDFSSGADRPLPLRNGYVLRTAVGFNW